MGGTKAIDLGTHVAKGGDVGSWVVKQVKDPWNYVGAIPGGGAVSKLGSYIGNAKTVYDTHGNVRFLTSRRRSPHSGAHFDSRYTGRSHYTGRSSSTGRSS